MPVKSPVLETPRLILRPPRSEDFDDWAAFCADPDAMRFLGGVKSRPMAWRNFCTVGGAWSLYGFGYFSVIERATGRWLGRVGPWRPEAWPGTEIGWGLAGAATGKGYALEAAAAAIEWAFGALGWDEVIHCIEPANTASIRLATKLGARRLYETEMPPPLDGHATVVYGQTRAEWRASDLARNQA